MIHNVFLLKQPMLLGNRTALGARFIINSLKGSGSQDSFARESIYIGHCILRAVYSEQPDHFNTDSRPYRWKNARSMQTKVMKPIFIKTARVLGSQPLLEAYVERSE